ncbi:formate C-acetyltransferase/glycerol dehydratase family glycyl radical enzyme, partial [bacterium]|nr:formate C-acetyltransferase/glycerol dehydratase family glycyl radical enzyme [bacterium]
VIDEMKNHPFPNRLHDEYQISRKTKKELLKIQSYWKGKTVSDKIESQLSKDQIKGTHLGKEVFLINLYFFGGIGHTQANYEQLFENGFGGLRDRATKMMMTLNPSDPETPKKQEFYTAEQIAAKASTDFINRYAELARKLAKKESDTEWKNELLIIAQTCDNIAEKPPQTFREALQLWFIASTIVLIESNGHSISLGRFDQYMHPFYQKDIESGKATREDIQELIEISFIKFLWNTKLRDRLTVIANSGRGMGGDTITVGGVDRQGKDATNDLTYMVLDAHAHTRLAAPWLSVRFHPQTPRDLKVKTFNVIRIGTGKPKIFNDQASIPAMERAGRTREDANDYHVVGCVEIDCGGKEYGWHDAAYFSIAKVFELAINDGRCVGCGAHCRRWNECGSIGDRLGIQTGSIKDLTNIDQVKESYDKQMKYWCDLMVETIKIMDLSHQELKPLPYLSLMMDDCLGRGLDVSAGGAVYNFTGPQAVGVGTVADGFSTIKQLVFEENKVTGEQLLDAVENNWEGYEALYALVNSDKVHHYGNDDDYADEFARFAADTYCQHIENRPDARGGTFIPGVYSVSCNVAFGLTQWASIEGRKVLEPVSDCVGPVHTLGGAHDVKGPTAVAKSVTKLDHIRATNGTLLNWKFSPSSVAGETGLDNLISLMDVYFDRKGMHSQFNILSRETLLDAIEEPDEYKDLLVRVAGYSAYFVELSKPLQYDLLNRTELSFD